jgi:hypothetical protein
MALLGAIGACAQIACIGDYHLESSPGAENTCSGSAQGDPCSECLADACCPELEACVADQSCVDLVSCGAGCTTSDCMAACIEAYEPGYEAFDELWSCQSQSCPTSC